MPDFDLQSIPFDVIGKTPRRASEVDRDNAALSLVGYIAGVLRFMPDSVSGDVREGLIARINKVRQAQGIDRLIFVTETAGTICAADGPVPTKSQFEATEAPDRASHCKGTIMTADILDLSRGREVRSPHLAPAKDAAEPRPIPYTKFLQAEMLEAAREHAKWLRENGREATGLIINTLVADIENYREAFKGSAVIVNRAVASIDSLEQSAAQALASVTDLSRRLATNQLKLSALLITAEKLHPVIDKEIEDRKLGGNDEDWRGLQALSDELHSVLKAVRA